MYRVLILLFAIGNCGDIDAAVNSLKTSTATDLQTALDRNTWESWKKNFENTNPFATWKEMLDSYGKRIDLLEKNSATKEKVESIDNSLGAVKTDTGKRLDDHNMRLSKLEGFQMKVRQDATDKGMKEEHDNIDKKYASSLKTIDESSAKQGGDLKQAVASLSAQIEGHAKDNAAAREKLKKDLEEKIEHAKEDLGMDVHSVEEESKANHEKNAKTLASVVDLQDGVSKLHSQAAHLVAQNSAASTAALSALTPTAETQVATPNTVGIDLWKFSFLLLASFNLGGFAMYSYLASKTVDGESKTPLLG